MKISPKILLIIGMAYFLLILTLAIVSRITVMGGFVSIETENARVNGIRVLNEINDDMVTLSTTVGDWSPWDDTYQFIQDQNEAYIVGNLTDATLTNIRVNFMVFIDTSGQILFSKFVDLATGKMTPMPPGLGTAILAIPDLVVHKNLASDRTGILKTAQGPVLVASRPILKSDLTGPARGSLVMGRYLDDQKIQDISTTTRLNTQLFDWMDPSLPEDFRAAQPLLSAAKPIYITPLKKDLIATYLMLPDFSSTPAAILKVSADRKIYQKGRQTWWYYLSSMAIIGLVFTLLVITVINRIILVPLNRLNQNVQAIGNARHFHSRLRIETPDELGQLAAQINKMLEELSIAGKKLNEQSYQSGLSEMASDMLHQIRNSLSPIAGNIDLVEKSLDQTSLGRITQALEELAACTSSQTRHDDLLQFTRLALTRFETNLTDIRDCLKDAKKPIAGIENVLQEYQLTAQIQPQISPIDLGELLEDTLKKTPMADTRVMIDPELSDISKVLGNRVSVLKVVKTLLIITAHFTARSDEPGDIHITARETSEKNQTMVHLNILHTGKRLDPDAVAKIFERGFFSQKEYGADTSLHWCANVINAMGGRLHAQNQEGNQGTSFHLTLPKASPAYLFKEDNGDGN